MLNVDLTVMKSSNDRIYSPIVIDERQWINTCYTSTTLLALFEMYDLSILVPSE